MHQKNIIIKVISIVKEVVEVTNIKEVGQTTKLIIRRACALSQAMKITSLKSVRITQNLKTIAKGL